MLSPQLERTTTTTGKHAHGFDESILLIDVTSVTVTASEKS